MENFKKLLESEKSLSTKNKIKLFEFILWCQKNNPHLMKKFNNFVLTSNNEIINLTIIMDLLNLYKKYSLNFKMAKLEQQGQKINLANIEKIQNN